MGSGKALNSSDMCSKISKSRNFFICLAFSKSMKDTALFQASQKEPSSGAKSKSTTPSQSQPSGSGIPSQSNKFDDIPNSQIRKIIAKRLLESKQTVPHYYVKAVAELDAVNKMRESLKSQGTKVSSKILWLSTLKIFTSYILVTYMKSYFEINTSQRLYNMRAKYCIIRAQSSIWIAWIRSFFARKEVVSLQI